MNNSQFRSGTGYCYLDGIFNLLPELIGEELLTDLHEIHKSLKFQAKLKFRDAKTK